MRRTHRLSVRLIRWTIRYGFFLLFLSNVTLVSAKSNASVSHPSTRNHNLSDGSERGQTASADPRSSVGNAARLFRARDARSLPMGVQESSIIPFLMPIIWDKRLANDSLLHSSVKRLCKSLTTDHLSGNLTDSAVLV